MAPSSVANRSSRKASQCLGSGASGSKATSLAARPQWFVGDAGAVGLERHELTVGAAPPRALEESPRLSADRLLVGERVMICLESPESSTVAVQQSVAAVQEACRD